MSVIAARVNSNSIDVAADSILMKNEMKRTTNFNKLRKFDDFIIGGCGSAEELSLMFSYASSNRPVSNSIFDIHKFLQTFSEWKKSFTANELIENCYVMIWKNKLFETDGMFVQEITDYTAIGEGEAYALTALFMGCSPKDAVKTASKLCSSVSEPVVCFSVKL